MKLCGVHFPEKDSASQFLHCSGCHLALLSWSWCLVIGPVLHVLLCTPVPVCLQRYCSRGAEEGGQGTASGNDKPHLLFMTPDELTRTSSARTAWCWCVRLQWYC
jgi:hypothetical protein